MALVYLFLAAILAVSGFVAWKMMQQPADLQADHSEKDKLRGERDQLMQDYAIIKANLERKSEEVGELKAALETERKESNERKGKMKNIYDAMTKLEAKHESLLKEYDGLKKLATKHEAAEERKEKEFEERLARLEAAKVSLEQERARVIRAEEEQKILLEEERDRLWADHENTVVASLTDLCKQPSFSFTAYNNTNLPDGFDGSLKPDFMIEFLGQYIIFDAKVSKAKSLRTYVSDQVKKTIDKVKDNELIYKSIFLVVPTSALAELKEHYHLVDGYSIYIVCVEALPALLASLKRITLYEFAEGLDPQQRENIVQLVAELDFHINLRNAADIILTKMGTDILGRAQRIDPALAEEVAVKKQPMNAKASLSASDLKKLVTKLTSQVDEVQALVLPAASVKKHELKAAESFIADSLFS